MIVHGQAAKFEGHHLNSSGKAPSQVGLVDRRSRLKNRTAAH
jgi:hypothetical protein